MPAIAAGLKYRNTSAPRSNHMQSWISPTIRLSARTNSVYSGLPRPANGSTVRPRRIDTAVFGPPTIGELPKKLAKKPTKTAQYSPYSGATPAR